MRLDSFEIDSPLFGYVLLFFPSKYAAHKIAPMTKLATDKSLL